MNHTPGVWAVRYHTPGVWAVRYHTPGVWAVRNPTPGVWAVRNHKPGVWAVRNHTSDLTASHPTRCDSSQTSNFAQLGIFLTFSTSSVEQQKQLNGVCTVKLSALRSVCCHSHVLASLWKHVFIERSYVPFHFWCTEIAQL
jgi:hypothetical protein